MTDHVLITGATGGIGSEVVRALHQRGFAVTGWDIEAAHESAPQGVQYFRVDQTSDQAIANAVEVIPPVHHVVMLAGRALPLEAQLDHEGVLPNTDTFAESVALNLVSHYRVIYALHPLLAASATSAEHVPSMTLAASINAIQGFGLPAYSSAKAGLHGLVTALSEPLGRDGIRINAIDLGTVRTPASDGEWAPRAGHFERLAASSALGRLTDVESAGAAFVSLVTGFPTTTGSVVRVDAGQSVFRARD